MKVALVGSRYFAATVFDMLRRLPGVELTSIVAPAADDRLALAARAAGLDVHVLANPKTVPGEAIAEGTDLIVAAHTHARVSDEALARSRHRGVGYHPSLLPRHRGIAAVEWTILEGDAIAGGTVYHLADGWDAGAIAAQDWCFVQRGEGARELWERALAPMGLSLLQRVVSHVRDRDEVPAMPQDLRFVTKAPLIKRSVVLTEDTPDDSVALVATVIGADRHGIVNALSERAQRHGANWAASRLARAAGEFAGMVHFDVPRDSAEALATSLRALDSAGLRITVSRSAAGEPADGLRSVELQLVGDDRKGIVSSLTRTLASRMVSIENMHTEIVTSPGTGKRSFKVVAHLLVPAALTNEQLHAELDGLAREMMLDVALGDRPSA
jgi:methionyl-tRNA formyltransferase